jgi:hypothetical protein
MSVDATSRARELWESGRRWDDVLQALRDEGQSKTASIRATTEVLRLSLADSKRLVHGSRVWRDRRELDDELHDALIAEISAEALARGA